MTIIDDGTATMPCMKTMSIKILCNCWQTDHSATLKRIAEDITAQDVDSSVDQLYTLLRSTAKNEVAQAVTVLRERNDPDLLIPLVQMRCDKELYVLTQEKDNPVGNHLRVAYVAELVTAWEHIKHLCENASS